MDLGPPAVFRVNPPVKDYCNQNYQNNHESRPESAPHGFKPAGEKGGGPDD